MGDDVDYSGAGALREAIGAMKERSVAFSICEVAPNVKTQLDRYGLTDLIGAANFHEDLQAAVAAYEATAGATS